MNRADDFIQMYNRLDHWMKKLSGADSNMSFSAAVSRASAKNRAVKTHAYFLKSMGDLRNAIIHDEHYRERVIAVPDASVVEEFQRKCNEIMSPRNALSLATKNITIYPLSEKLSCVLPEMKDNDYSQIVVEKEDATHSMITRDGIARWMEANMVDDLVSLADVTLGDIHVLEEGVNWHLCKVDSSVYDIAELFSRNDRRIQAVILTQNGRDKEKPIGVITFWDISKNMIHDYLA